jgi:hypothetical protein
MRQNPIFQRGLKAAKPSLKKRVDQSPAAIETGDLTI